MNGKLLETKIGDWAASLGFCLPNGSAPPPNYFASLIATPHRRQLWEVIIESVKPRQKIENMRKKLLVLNLREENKNFNCNNKRPPGRIKLLMRQNELEEKIMEQNKIMVEFEKNILVEASDLLFEVCKLADLEKQCEEYKERMLVLKLLCKRESLHLEEFRNLISNFKRLNIKTFGKNNESSIEEKFSQFEGELFSPNSCKKNINFFHDCSVQRKIDNLSDSGATDSHLWENILNLKRVQCENFSGFLMELNGMKKDLLQEREMKAENILKSSMIKLKQDVTVKSLQLMLNEAEGQFLNSEINSIIEKIKMLVFKDSPDEKLNENGSYLEKEIVGDSFSHKRNLFLDELKMHLIDLGLISYRNFLKEEISRLEQEETKMTKVENDFQNGENSLKESLNAIDSIHSEIIHLNSEKREQENEINRLWVRLEKLRKEIEEEIEREEFVDDVNKIVGIIKTDTEKQIDLFLEIPLEAFKMADDFSGGNSSACESIFSREKYGGELKKIFRSILIHPQINVEFVLKEMEKRKKLADEMRKFTSGREKLAEDQKRILSRLNSIEHDSDKCEKNFQNSNEILSNVLFKSMKINFEIEFVERILKNWLEQPYRHMIKDEETVDGFTLKEYEELCKKSQKKKRSK